MPKHIPNESIDCVVTSPPYDTLRKYNGFSFDADKVIKELYRVLKQGGVVIWVVSDKTKDGSESGTSFRQALMFMENGFKLYDTMIYAKNNPIPLNHKRYEQTFEYMFVFSKGTPKTFNPIKVDCSTNGVCGNFRHTPEGKLEPAHKISKTKKDKIKGNIWYYSVGNNKTTKDEYYGKHPAVFPEKLVEDHLLSWTNENDIVLDPFCGSGTTCKVAHLMNRKYIGIDISEEYINEICIPRLNNFKKN